MAEPNRAQSARLHFLTLSWPGQIGQATLVSPWVGAYLEVLWDPNKFALSH